MINLDTIIYNVLDTIAPTYQGYPLNWNELPVISYVCEQNSSAIKAAEEITDYIVYKIDLFCNVQDDDIGMCEDINRLMNNLGFTRQQCVTLQEEGGVHIVFRYYMYIDKNNRTYSKIYRY